MEAIPDSTESTVNAASTRSSSRRVREFKNWIVTEENESKSSEFASGHETIQSISNSTEHPIQDNKQGVNSNRQEDTKSAANRKIMGYKQATKKRLRVDAAASLLATLNERAYSRSLLRDANSINHRIVLPMGLPWMHDTVPLSKTIPFDIDEMPDILAAGEGRDMPFAHTPSSMNKKERKSKYAFARNSASLHSVARRCSDPGIIDLTSIINYEDENNLHYRFKGNSASFRSIKSLPGEIALLSFEIAHRRKSTVQDHAKTISRKKEWSVRINSTSSKSSILPSDLAGYLEARLPAEVQDGRFLSMKRAKAIAKALGSYDCRHGLPPTNPTGKNANRITVGRTRRMWTAKSPPGKPQRVFFTSLLTGEKLDSGSQKRPRDVRLAIKVEGEYCYGENSSQYSPLSATHFWGMRTKKRCVVNPNNYASILLKHGNIREKDVLSDQERSEGEGESGFREPQFDCLPDNTGVICVTCTSPGNITIPSIHDILNNSARQNSLHCTVCWAPRSSQLGEVQTCAVCGLSAHLQCCLDPGEVSHIAKGGTISGKWMCAVCCLRRQQCANDTKMCPLPIFWRSYVSCLH
ncbi:unnamed protein product [Cylindrotheca closterium]|uniref:Uncharacterized protein n=1 Tax=Cylindrotheca closterium TaxID=2856 RepID=A0AAD2CI27_9STRA|nr:unnamed protein product [Cylindrotheca closterium]